VGLYPSRAAGWSAEEWAGHLLGCRLGKLGGGPRCHAHAQHIAHRKCTGSKGHEGLFGYSPGALCAAALSAFISTSLALHGHDMG
jgi:hypothetical protein